MLCCAQGPQQSELGKVMGEKAVDVILIRRSYVVLCFYNLQVVGHAVHKTVARLFQGLLRQLLVALGNVHCGVGSREVGKGVAHFVVHASGEVEIFRLLALQLR